MALKVITDNYALYNGDCCELIKKVPDNSVGLSVYSPPFSSLYSYSDDPRDLANCKSYPEFLDHYGFLVQEHMRTMMPGRVVAVHCSDLPTFKRGGEEIGLSDFPGDIIRLFQKHGFVFHSRCVIWKDPLVAATRTKAIGLAHKQIVKDSALCRMGIADQILAFRKPGENPVPIRHPRGLTVYHGSKPIPSNLDRLFLMPLETELLEKNPYDSRKDKRSHLIWQRYASPVWDDIDQTKVMPYREARGCDDARHICPLQLQVIERCLVLWSAPGDVVLTPFMGVGSEVYCAVKNGRRGVGFELKRSYFKQAVLNVKDASRAVERKTVESMR